MRLYRRSRNRGLPSQEWTKAQRIIGGISFEDRFIAVKIPVGYLTIPSGQRIAEKVKVELKNNPTIRLIIRREYSLNVRNAEF